MLKVRNLSLLHRPGQELIDINLHIGRGEVLVLLGPNGSGKSALIEAVTDPEINYQGDVILNHYKANSEPDKVRAQMGVLLDRPELPSYLNGFEYLEFVGTFYHLTGEERTARILKMAQYFDCQRHLYTTIERVSLAVRQKIALIASLLAEPAVLVWDEPFQHLDYEAQVVALSALEDAVKRGASVLVSTNNLAVAEQIGSYFVVLQNGQIAAEGSLTQLAHQAQSSKDLTVIYPRIVRA